MDQGGAPDYSLLPRSPLRRSPVPAEATVWSLNHLQRPHFISASFTLKYERLRSVLWLQQGVETAASGLPCSQAPLGGLSLLFTERRTLPPPPTWNLPITDSGGPSRSSALLPPRLATGASPLVPDEGSSFFCTMLLVQHWCHP